MILHANAAKAILQKRSASKVASLKQKKVKINSKKILMKKTLLFFKTSLTAGAKSNAFQ